ncbi:MAG: DUF3048 domain-containing protein [Firmicutes bacterium]|nr:DUF3048 domain-containing protein [Bacillota bacterium]
MSSERKGKKRKSKDQKRRIAVIVFSLLIIVGVAVYYLFFTGEEPIKKIKNVIPIEKKKLTIVDEDSNKRPIAVMYDNNVGNNNHAGLQKSYITYEIIVEGGLTRIMALFKDQDVNLIGPVRSSRHYFLDYALESDAIYTHFGWSTYAENDIKSLGVNNINGLYDSIPFWREKTIAAPHNVFTTTDKVYSYAKEKKYNTETDNWKLLNYTTDKVNLDKPVSTKTVVNEETGKKEKVEEKDPNLLTANSISMSYSTYQVRSYDYNSENGYYLRSMNGTAHIDKESKQQLHYKNIIIERVSNSQLDSYGRQDLSTTGSGEGYYITNGYALPIKWTKSSRSDKTKYTYLNGKEVKVNDGNTFIQIVPVNSTITIE